MKHCTSICTEHLLWKTSSEVKYEGGVGDDGGGNSGISRITLKQMIQ